MGCFAVIRCPSHVKYYAPIVDGQFFIDTDPFLAIDDNVMEDFNHMYMDYGDTRKEVGITSWYGLSSKPFERLDNDTIYAYNALDLQVRSQEWDEIINKPFERIGSTLSVKNGALTFAYKWNQIEDRPFYTVGYGLNVDSNGNLNADVPSVVIEQLGNASNIEISYQSLQVGDMCYWFANSTYMEYSQTLSTTNDTVFTFSSSAIDADSLIQVYTSIWGMTPKSISVTNNSCVVTFPSYDTSATLKCRIYILNE